MNLLIMGLPGAGKGTQAELIVKEYGITHLSVGDLFRNLLKEDSELSKEVKSYINNGNLVPDELTVKMLKEELKNDKYLKGFLLDGFPRNLAQAKALDELMAEMNMNIDDIIYISIDESIIIDRLSNRQVCPKCQATYHKINNKPEKEGICDKCGADLIQREDDKPDKIAHRMTVAKEQTIPVIDYYKENTNVIEIDAKERKIEDIFEEIKGKLK